MRPDSSLVAGVAVQLEAAGIKTEPLTETFGLAVVSSDAVDLQALDPDIVIQLYRLSGALLFRGFDVTLDTFQNFTSKFTHNYIVNGSLTRKPVSGDGTTQTVNAGDQLIPPHAEMAYTPFRPELLWFYCDTPASEGGETLVCDGLDVWSRLKPATKELFLNQKVSYRKTFSNSKHDLNSIALLWLGQAVDTSSIGDRLSHIPDTLFRVEDDGSFYLEYTVPAAQKPKYHEALAFANSVIVEHRSCFFENGEAIARDLRLELFYEASNCSLQHKWRTGDVLMVDNSRMMHGRAPFRDPRRNILVRMGREAF